MLLLTKVNGFLNMNTVNILHDFGGSKIMNMKHAGTRVMCISSSTLSEHLAQISSVTQTGDISQVVN